MSHLHKQIKIIIFCHMKWAKHHILNALLKLFVRPLNVLKRDWANFTTEPVTKFDWPDRLL